VAEWLKAPDSKSGVGVSLPEVRILSLPPTLPARFFPHLVMPIELFRASRWTRGNFLFPTVIEVTDKAVTRHKRSWLSQEEMTINISKIASVHIKTGLLWSDILIESSGGSDPLSSHGHRKADAVRLKELIPDAQAERAKKPDEE
jgi:hypothetical protein